MGRTFHIRAVTSDQVDQAFPLVQAMAADLTLAEWRDYTTSLTQSGPMAQGGIMSAQGEDGYIYGLFCYQTARDLRHGPTLEVENLIVLDIVDRQGAIDALTQAIDQVAREASCKYVHVTLPQRQPSSGTLIGFFLEPLQKAGHMIDGVRLFKPVLGKRH